MRRALLLIVAAAGQIAAFVAFLSLPWATGRGVFSGRGFTGPELASLASNLDLLVPARAGPAGALAAIALYAVPTAALAGALFAVLSVWIDRGAVALHASAVAGLAVAAVGMTLILLLAAGPAAGESLSRIPGFGAPLATTGGLLAAVAAYGASKASGR